MPFSYNISDAYNATPTIHENVTIVISVPSFYTFALPISTKYSSFQKSSLT